jgi:hypothetical protein
MGCLTVSIISACCANTSTLAIARLVGFVFAILVLPGSATLPVQVPMDCSLVPSKQA